MAKKPPMKPQDAKNKKAAMSFAKDLRKPAAQNQKNKARAAAVGKMC